MPRRKAEKKQEPQEKQPLEIDEKELSGQLILKGLSSNVATSQGYVCYFCVYVNGVLAGSPWMTVEENDLIEVYTDNNTKVFWRVGDEETNTDTSDERIRPVVDSYYGKGGVPLPPLAKN